MEKQKNKKAAYSIVDINGKKYVKIKRRAGFKKNKNGELKPYYREFYGASFKAAKNAYSKYCKENCLDEHGMPDLNAKRIERRTFRELFDDWLENVFLQDHRYSDGTRNKYLHAYHHAMENMPIMDEYIVTLIGSDLQKTYNNMSCGASTVKACHKLMRLFFKYQEAQGVCTDITRSIVMPQVPHKRIDQSIDVLTKEEASKILEGFKDHRLYLLVVLALRTGCRISELLALQYDDITDAGIRVNKQLQDGGKIITTKTPAAIRTIPINQNTRDLIEEHKKWHRAEMMQRSYRTDFIFTTNRGTPYDRSNAQKACNRVYKRIGVREIGFHVYRHTFGSDLANKGVPIQTLAALLGHTDVSITSRYYINVDDDSKRRAIEALSV